MDCRQVGLALADLGGARRKVEDPLDLTAASTSCPQIGDQLSQGRCPGPRSICDREGPRRRPPSGSWPR